MNGREWDRDEIEKLEAFHIMGLTLQEQADRLDRPSGSIATKRRALGLRYRDEPNEIEEGVGMKQPDWEALFIMLMGFTVFGILTIGSLLYEGSGL
jgi:hypothetical protein